MILQNVKHPHRTAILRRTQVVPSNPLKADPSRTATLRRLFETDMRLRFDAIKGRVLRLVEDEDAFGLRFILRNPLTEDVLKTKPTKRQFKLSKPQSEDRNLTPFNVVTNTRWAFLTTSAKVVAFNNWLRAQVTTTVVPNEIGDSKDLFFQRYVEAGYLKGAARAFDDVRKAALFSKGSVSDFFEGTKREFLQSSFGRPVAIEKVKLLTGRVFTELKGVTESMAQRLTRELADGLVRGESPRTVARAINKGIDQIGKNRALAIARTETIRAHAEGQLDALEQLGVLDVGVMVEWSTAGDDRVCPLCQPMDGVVLKVKEAHGLIPRHVSCRCAHIPANIGESQKDQIRGKGNIQAARDRSIKAEIPKRSKRTLAEQKRRSRWPGADTTIAKPRPKSILDPAKKGKGIKPGPKPSVKPSTPMLKPEPIPKVTKPPTPALTLKPIKQTPVPTPSDKLTPLKLKPPKITVPKPKPITTKRVFTDFDDPQYRKARFDWENGLTDAQIEAFAEWTGDLSDDIRACMSGFDPAACAKDIEEFIRQIQKALGTAPEFNGKVYRGLQFNGQNELDKFVVGVRANGLTTRALTSTSRDVDIGRKFAVITSGRKGVLLEMRTKSGVSIESLSIVDEELEILLNIDTKFKVVDIKLTEKEFDVTTVVLEEI